MIKWILRKLPVIGYYIKENERLIRQFSELQCGKISITQMAIENGCMTMQATTDLAHLIAEMFLRSMKESGAENYMEFQFSQKCGGARIIVTAQKSEGKTPHELRREAEMERDALKAKYGLESR